MESGNTPPVIAPVTRTFADILPSQQLQEALTKIGIAAPTPIQAQTIPAVLSGRDVIAQAKTGSGKTFAFVLPLLIKLELMPAELNTTYGIILTPTRELANQIVEVIRSLNTSFEPVCLIGGVSNDSQVRAMNRDRRIVVGTPGRVQDQLRQGNLTLKNARYFVLDEADEMLSMDFLEDITTILRHIPGDRQGLFISATITPRVENLARTFLREPQRIDVSVPGEDSPSLIEHFYYEVGEEITAKVQALCDIIETQKPKSAIIFCNMKSETELVEVFLRRRGFDARRMNSDLNQKQRDFIMQKIRANELRFLVGTDIAARGIDIAQIELVVNYSISDQAEVYVHRTGRTGRAGRSGRAVSLVGPSDFAAFLNLKKSVPTLELKKSQLPSEQELRAARLEHFKEMLTQIPGQLSTRDRDIAIALLAEHGLGTPAPEFLSVVSQLCRFMTEHFVTADIKSLEDEMAEARAAAGAAATGDSEHGGHSRGGGGGGGYGGRGDRGGDRGGSRGGRSGGGHRGGGDSRGYGNSRGR